MAIFFPAKNLFQIFFFLICSLHYSFLRFLHNLWLYILCTIFPAYRKERELLTKLERSKTYKEWEQTALQLDEILGNNKWKALKESGYYDVSFIDHKLNILNNNNLEDLINELREGLLRNIAGIGNPLLYESYVGTKYQIEKYIATVCEKLEYLSRLPSSSTFPLDRKFNFFYETRQSFGRSALLLSGGASLGLYHLGVVKCLFENGLLPRVISGSSVGSIIAGIVGISTNEELKRLFEGDNSKVNLECFDKLDNNWFSPLKRKVQRLFTKGVLMDISILEECVKQNLGNYTFKEAYDKTGRILNITVAGTQDFHRNRLLNYLTAPNVLIWSAAVASCALKYLFDPVPLLAKDTKEGVIVPYHPSGLKWSDGSVGTDLPMKRLSELFNVNFFIVSQVNPHMVPYLNTKYFVQKRNFLLRWGFYLLWDEWKHRAFQLEEMGLIPLFLSGVVSVIVQTYEGKEASMTQYFKGDITIVPKFLPKDYLALLSNPNKDMIQGFFLTIPIF